MKIQQNNKYYIKALKRESEFWEGSNTLYQNQSDFVIEYEQLNRFGDKKISMYDFFKKLGIFENVLSIGSGDGSFEFILLKEGVINNITFIDISQKAIDKINSKAKDLGLQNRVKTLVQDLNFIKLKENSYDFICCLNILHHVINIEECIFELNKSLKNKGIILIDDFIGEKKMLWQDSKIKFMDFFNTFIFEKYGIKLNKIIKTNPKVLTNNCPFECIRSNELYSIISNYYKNSIIKESLYGHVFNFYGQLGNNLSNEIMNYLEIFDNYIKNNSLLKPTRIFGLYKKSDEILLKTNFWTKKEIKENIGLSLINEKVLLKFAENIKKRNYKIYEILKKVYFFIRK